ncbi:MAG: hemerythrin domain-containing protein [Nitriliruptorales bacterium]|nr:hemerythrin domain-containing protein [Nitriliruptorales bacterium]
MDALTLLEKDHDTVRELFSQFKTAKERPDTNRMRSLQQRIFHELEIHTAIEEEVFYPAAEQVGQEAEELVNEGVEEHHVVDVLMSEIRGLEAEDDAWVAKMSVLIENVEHHAEEEETELFPKLREVFGKDRLAELGRQLEQAKQRRQQASADPSRYAAMSRDELYERAKQRDIPGRSGMTKDDLAKALEDADA